MEITVNRDLNRLGSNVIIQIKDAFENVSNIISYDDQIDGESNLAKVTRTFTYSYDGEEWSFFKKVTDGCFGEIDLTKTFYLKFKFEVTEKLNDVVLKIKSINLSLEYNNQDEIVCTPANALDFSTADSGNNFLEIASALVPLQNEMNLYLNHNFGQEVVYFRTEPELESTDVFLNEYSLKGVVEQKCIKVVVPDNKIPEPKHNYDEWGINFEEFEIHISKLYFESMFGKNTKPRTEDFMLFPKLNRMYYIYSNHLGRGLNESANYYICSLKKYDNNTSVLKSDELEEKLVNSILEQETIFQEQLNEEKVDIVNDQQNSQKAITQDIVRDEIHSGMQIVDSAVINNGTQLIRSYYDLSSVPLDEVAIKYKKPINLDEKSSIGYTSWFKLPERDSVLNNIDIVEQQRINLTTIKLIFNQPISSINLTESDSISRETDVYEIDAIIDEMTITIKSRTLIDSSKFDGYKKADKVNLLFSIADNFYFTVDLYNKNKIRVRLNNNMFDFNAIQLDYDKWYGVILNISNNYNYLGVYIWETEDRGIVAGDKYSTRLKSTYKKEITKDVMLIIPNESIPYISGSNTHISNIRIFKKAIDHEVQSFVIGDRTVKKPSLAFVIDDADLVFNLPRIGRGSTYINERNSD